MSRRSELKENILAAKVEVALKFIIDHAVQFAIGGGVALVGVLIASVFFLRSGEAESAAWSRVAYGQALYQQGEYGQARAALQQVVDERPGGDPATVALYFLGAAFYEQNEFEEAERAYREVLEVTDNPHIRPLTLAALGSTLESQGRHGDAAEMYRRFMERHGDHFMAPRTQLALGRALLNNGETDEARDALGQLIDLYPTSGWAENARRFLDNLGSR